MKNLFLPKRFYSVIESQDFEGIGASVSRLKASRLDVMEDTHTPKKYPLNVESGVYREATGRPSLTGFGNSLVCLFRVVRPGKPDSPRTERTPFPIVFVVPKPIALRA